MASPVEKNNRCSLSYKCHEVHEIIERFMDPSQDDPQVARPPKSHNIHLASASTRPLHTLDWHHPTSALFALEAIHYSTDPRQEPFFKLKQTENVLSNLCKNLSQGPESA